MRAHTGERSELETEATGPIQDGVWDTRTRQNCRWCDGCRKWLRLTTFSWIPSLDKALEHHKREYCKGSVK